MDEIDKESLHLLVFLFLQFLSHPEMAKVPDGHGGHGHGSGHGSRQGGDHGEREHKEHHKTTQAARNVQAAAMNRCFQCLYSLLGYNEVERRFQGQCFSGQCFTSVTSHEVLQKGIISAGLTGGTGRICFEFSRHH